MKHQVSNDSNASPVTRHAPDSRPAADDSSPSPIAPRPSPLIHCLTFNVEEHFQASAFDSPMRRRHWDQFESRVERNTEKLLELLATQQIRATFFVLGWIAERHPGLVRKIAGDGHEIASHGYAHELITAQTPAQFREDVRKTKEILEDLIAAPVLGYRGQGFTVTQETTWAVPILVEEGYVYHSNFLSRAHCSNGYRIRITPVNHQVSTDLGILCEIPPSVLKLAGVWVPIAEGGCLRLLPYWLVRLALKGVEAKRQPVVMQVRVWELDPDQPRMNGSRVSRFRHYVNLHKTEERLVSLLHEFAFGPIREAVQSVLEIAATRTRSTQSQPRADGPRTPAKQPGRVRKLQVRSPSRSRPSVSSAKNIEVI